jgi:hypothetical protein
MRLKTAQNAFFRKKSVPKSDGRFSFLPSFAIIVPAMRDFDHAPAQTRGAKVRRKKDARNLGSHFRFQPSSFLPV